jgi:hypothetical protein
MTATAERVGSPLVVANGQVQPQHCGLYAHEHQLAIVETHHVIPVSWWAAAGQPTPTNAVTREVCASCHQTVHAAIDAILAGVGTDLLAPRCVRLAIAGIEGGKVAGLTPAPTL